ncbi:hypothetical protein Ait01nite_082050 [Actinoplanes italicus]|uniref:Putative phage baseplate assembly protein n=1 Tax=Actinoplanes italicus TaxID=113567 RepID=A0A2T0K341_9ACTN|nr:putative baseplate assembly protein [Actinoplanes italicus]PRX17282.1 putative phage baseplate assembly protein [Actinoplanes italicus]GIE35160.1 hypothetical protein Ait01nite_082050 [Actinoplanes italicus]
MTGDRAPRAPRLDRRGADELLALLRERAAVHLPRWTPPESGDPGTVLQLAFARLMEVALARLNRAPDKHLLTFLDTMGVSLLPPAAATVPLTFGLAPGAAPTVVPAGTAADRPAGAGSPAVRFETTAALTVVPSRLIAVHTVDPVADGSGTGTAPFTGETPLEHVLWIGCGPLLETGRDLRLVLEFALDGATPAEELHRFFRRAEFVHTAGGVRRVVRPDDVETGFGGLVVVSLTIGAVDASVLSGPGLPRPLEDRWLGLRLREPLPVEPFAAGLTGRVISTLVEALDRPPDAALAGSVPVDVTRDFLPFGEQPRAGDVFHIGGDEVFGKGPGIVDLTVTARSGTPFGDLELAWEFLGADGWTSLEVEGAVTLTQERETARITLPGVVPRIRLGQRTSRWIRVRIATGDYGTPDRFDVVDGKLVKRDGTLDPPRLTSIRLTCVAFREAVVVRQTGPVHEDVTGRARPLFTGADAVHDPALATPDPALYLGFDTLTADLPVTLHHVAALRSTATDTAPVVWECWTGAAWRPLPVLDETAELRTSGTITLLVPAGLAPLDRFGDGPALWVRARAPRTLPTDTRRLHGLFLNTVPAIQAATVAGEVLGGPGPRFALSGSPVLPGPAVRVREGEPPPAGERAVIEAEEGPDALTTEIDPVTGRDTTWVRWHEVPSLVRSGPRSRHYTLEHTTGVITFGDGVRGLAPPRGTGGIRATYRVGGGSRPGLAAGTINQLATTIPGVNRVTNPVPAEDGAPAETTALVTARGPQVLRHRDRAVAAGDLAWLAREAAGTRVARSVCLPNLDPGLRRTPGWVTVVIVPAGDAPRPTPGPQLIATVQRHLAERAAVALTGPAGDRIAVIGPGHLRVGIEAEVAPRDLTTAGPAKLAVLDALDRFLHPLHGGPAATGWELGRDVHVSEIAELIESLPGVSHVRSLRLHPAAQRREVAFARPTAPLSGPGAPAGTLLAAPDLSMSARTLEPVPAGTLVDRLTVGGVAEGDRLSCVLDVFVDGPGDEPGSLRFRPLRPHDGPTPPPGSPVVLLDGRAGRLLSPIREDRIMVTGLDPVPGEETILSVFHPAEVTVTDVIAAGDGVLDVWIEPAELAIPAGTVLGRTDQSARITVTEPAEGSAVTRLTCADLTPQTLVVLGPGLDGRNPVAAEISAVRPVTSTVHLDTVVFPYAGGHRITLVGG